MAVLSEQTKHKYLSYLHTGVQEGHIKLGEPTPYVSLRERLNIRRSNYDLWRVILDLKETGGVSISKQGSNNTVTINVLPDLETDAVDRKWNARPAKNEVRKLVYQYCDKFLRTRDNHTTILLPGEEFAELPLLLNADPQAHTIGFERNVELSKRMVARAEALNCMLVALPDEQGLDHLHQLGVKASFFWLDRMGHYTEGFRDAIRRAYSVATPQHIQLYTAQLARKPHDYYRPMLRMSPDQVDVPQVDDTYLAMLAVCSDTARLAIEAGYLPLFLTALYYKDEGHSPMFTWGWQLVKLNPEDLQQFKYHMFQAELLERMVHGAPRCHCTARRVETTTRNDQR